MWTNLNEKQHTTIHRHTVPSKKKGGKPVKAESYCSGISMDVFYVRYLHDIGYQVDAMTTIIIANPFPRETE